MTLVRFVKKWGWEFGSLAVVLAGVAAYLLIRMVNSVDAGPEPGDLVQTPDGTVSFTAPEGWLQSPCSGERFDCVEVAPAGAADGDAIAAGVLTGPINTTGDNPIAALLYSLPSAGAERITIDGVAAVKLDGAEAGMDGGIMVVAFLPDGNLFALSCEYENLESEIRAGCAMVVDTLDLPSRTV